MSKPTIYLIQHIEEALQRARANRERAIVQYEMMCTAVHLTRVRLEQIQERSREWNQRHNH